ncbi:MAG: chorismate dehydratase [Pirellulaceae bacterium]|nr:MAG: chorismate dehydratase [Pirellulaceae bacterium]
MRIGAVRYLNTKPLIHHWERHLPQAGLLLDLPSRLADRLTAGQLDVALIPSVEYFHQPQWEIVSDACIACRGPVRSVRLLFRCPPRDVKTVALDEGSRTSATLARILLARRYDLHPQLRPLAIDQPYDEAEADAVLVIGDRAMRVEDGRWEANWDLGEQWVSLTGLPFVFAMWVARAPAIGSAVAGALARCRDAGLRDARRLAETLAPQYGLTADDCWRYFTQQLHFHLGPRERAGMDLFQQWATELQLIPSSPSLTT